MRSAKAVLIQGHLGLLLISSYQGVLRGDLAICIKQLFRQLLCRISRSYAEHVSRVVFWLMAQQARICIRRNKQIFSQSLKSLIREERGYLCFRTGDNYKKTLKEKTGIVMKSDHHQTSRLLHDLIQYGESIN